MTETLPQTTGLRIRRAPAAVAAPLRAVPYLAPRDHATLREHAYLAARYGQTGVAPFISHPDVQVVDLLGGVAAAGFVAKRRWAVTAGDVVAPADVTDSALSEYLDFLHDQRLRPVFMAASDPLPYQRHGFALVEIADEAVLDLASFTMKCPERANMRHSVASARRASLTIAPYAPWQDEQIAEVSREWLSTKRGGELGFTLSRHGDVAAQLGDRATDLWVVLDGSGTVQAWCTWRHYLGGRGRVIDVMRRRAHAPNPAMDYLIAGVLEHYRDAGVVQASLASVPREHGAVAERVYPCRSLRAYKQKFHPQWEPRWLAVSTAWQRPFALAAICSAYCPGGMHRALVRNR